jgi:hypothetical protein
VFVAGAGHVTVEPLLLPELPLVLPEVLPEVLPDVLPEVLPELLPLDEPLVLPLALLPELLDPLLVVLKPPSAVLSPLELQAYAGAMTATASGNTRAPRARRSLINVSLT